MIMWKCAQFAAVFLVTLLSGTAYSSELSVFCARGEVHAVRALLDEGTNPDEKDVEGYTPLMRTILAGRDAPLSMHNTVIGLLLQAGADPNIGVAPRLEEDHNPVSTMAALHWAVYRGTRFLEMTLILLENGADPNLPGALGPPLHMAAGLSGASSDHVRLLLEWGADVHGKNQWGVTPLVEAVTGENPSAPKIALLLEAGADVNDTFDWEDHHGMDVLMAAAMNATADVVRLLIDHGARRFSRCNGGLTAFDYALLAGRLDNAELIR